MGQMNHNLDFPYHKNVFISGLYTQYIL